MNMDEEVGISELSPSLMMKQIKNNMIVKRRSIRSGMEMSIKKKMKKQKSKRSRLLDAWIVCASPSKTKMGIEVTNSFAGSKGGYDNIIRGVDVNRKNIKHSLKIMRKELRKTMEKEECKKDKIKEEGDEEEREKKQSVVNVINAEERKKLLKDLETLNEQKYLKGKRQIKQIKHTSLHSVGDLALLKLRDTHNTILKQKSPYPSPQRGLTLSHDLNIPRWEDVVKEKEGEGEEEEECGDKGFKDGGMEMLAGENKVEPIGTPNQQKLRGRTTQSFLCADEEVLPTTSFVKMGRGRKRAYVEIEDVGDDYNSSMFTDCSPLFNDKNKEGFDEIGKSKRRKMSMSDDNLTHPQPTLPQDPIFSVPSFEPSSTSEVVVTPSALTTISLIDSIASGTYRSPSDLSPLNTLLSTPKFSQGSITRDKYIIQPVTPLVLSPQLLPSNMRKRGISSSSENEYTSTSPPTSVSSSSPSSPSSSSTNSSSSLCSSSNRPLLYYLQFVHELKDFQTRPLHVCLSPRYCIVFFYLIY
jgi:hypothetical protein